MAIKRIIAFGSAKGGVGKSSITASVALSLAKQDMMKSKNYNHPFYWAGFSFYGI